MITFEFCRHDWEVKVATIFGLKTPVYLWDFFIFIEMTKVLHKVLWSSLIQVNCNPMGPG